MSIAYDAEVGEEAAPTFTSNLPYLVWKIEGVTSGKYWLFLYEGKVQVAWKPAGSGATANARRALGVQQVEIDQAMFDYMTSPTGGGLPVLVPKP